VVAVVIPTYKARGTIERVVQRALAVSDIVVVVDDGDPDRSADLVRDTDPRVHVVRHEVNRGVGGATKTGMREAIALGAQYIVKIDSDDQMDTSYVPFMIETLERYPEVDLVKGNRFADPMTRRRVVAEVEMPAIYSDEPPGPWGLRTLLPFPVKLTQRFFRRLLLNYLIVEINVGSLCGLIGFPLLTFAVLFGWHEWSGSLAEQTSRPSGTIVLALLLFMIGFQLSLIALLYDVGFSTPTIKLRRERADQSAHRVIARR